VAQAVTSDPTLTSGASLPRAQLHDHIPALLLDFEQRLAAGGAAKAADVKDAKKVQKGDAAAHGLQRWQQGFDLAEVTRELSQLNECVVVELDSYAVAHPELDRAVMPSARRIWAQQYGAAIGASTTQYFRLQQLEANSHIRDLEHALEALRELEQHRAQLWQQAAHDLRGNLGVVANATAGLTSANASELARGNFLRLLDRNVSALRHLLNDVTGLARLQGGQEHRSAERMDAAALLRDVCEGLQVYAQERNLFLRFNGPPALWVEGDPVKTRRITQNLVLNAIKYTQQGGVTVSWGDSDGGDAQRWFVQVQDTGPGFHAGPGRSLRARWKRRRTRQGRSRRTRPRARSRMRTADSPRHASSNATIPARFIRTRAKESDCPSSSVFASCWTRPWMVAFEDRRGDDVPHPPAAAVPEGS
jgi:signal transduction histidine kinase